MWVLLIILFVTPDRPFPSQYTLSSFSNEEDCLVMKDYVAKNMAEAYPGDKDYKIVCEVKV